MSYPALPTLQPAPASAQPWSQPGPDAASVHAADIDLRQLRHHSKNTLQRLLCEVARASEQQADWSQRHLLADLERRLMLSARVSDALFGFTAHPAPFARRLRDLADATMALLSEAGQSIEVRVDVQAPVPPETVLTVLRIAHEMIGNAVKHGLHDRAVGRITVAIEAAAGGTRLLVCDDGWGPSAGAVSGEGLALMQDLATPLGGSVSLRRQAEWTCAALELRRPQSGSLRWLGLMSGWGLMAVLPAAAIATSWACGLL